MSLCLICFILGWQIGLIPVPPKSQISSQLHGGTVPNQLYEQVELTQCCMYYGDSSTHRGHCCRRTISWLDLLESGKGWWLSQSLNSPFPGAGKPFSAFKQTESKSHFLSMATVESNGKPDLSMTTTKAIERPELITLHFCQVWSWMCGCPGVGTPC